MICPVMRARTHSLVSVPCPPQETTLFLPSHLEPRDSPPPHVGEATPALSPEGRMAKVPAAPGCRRSASNLSRLVQQMPVLFQCSWICLAMLPLTAPRTDETRESLFKNPASALQAACRLNGNNCPLGKPCREQGAISGGLRVGPGQREGGRPMIISLDRRMHRKLHTCKPGFCSSRRRSAKTESLPALKEQPGWLKAGGYLVPKSGDLRTITK